MQNGHITGLENGAASRGLANDVTDLLRAAGQVAPASNIGLIVQSHGGAANGLEGDSGRASVSDVHRGVTAGLAGSGHSSSICSTSILVLWAISMSPRAWLPLPTR